MRTNIHVQVAANIAKRLRQDPARSNRSIANELGINEGTTGANAAYDGGLSIRC